MGSDSDNDSTSSSDIEEIDPENEQEGDDGDDNESGGDGEQTHLTSPVWTFFKILKQKPDYAKCKFKKCGKIFKRGTNARQYSTK